MPSRSVSLDRQATAHKINDAFNNGLQPHSDTKHVNVHRFEETIAGRAYHIEVTPVSNRWRAQLRRLPGMPTAMMPFYGTTPEEAARQLTAWLTLAHRRQIAQLTAN